MPATVSSAVALVALPAQAQRMLVSVGPVPRRPVLGPRPLPAVPVVPVQQMAIPVKPKARVRTVRPVRPEPPALLVQTARPVRSVPVLVAVQTARPVQLVLAVPQASPSPLRTREPAA